MGCAPCRSGRSATRRSPRCRTISIAFETIRASFACVTLLLELARQPQRIPALLRLARDCRVAAGRLAIFLDAYLALAERAAEAFRSRPRWLRL